MNSFHRRFAAAFVFVAMAASTASAEEIPSKVRSILRQSCGDCHAGGASEGGLTLSLNKIDWTSNETIMMWEHVHQYVSQGVMPPHDADPLSKRHREQLLSWLNDSLITRAPIGGTRLRRLNRREYANTIERLFSINNYKVPESFPPDNSANGFDNQGEALVIAGTHLEALVEAANGVADQLFPPAAKPAQPTTVSLDPEDLVISYSSACIVDGAMRLASSNKNVTRHATWPSTFEARSPGVYRVALDLSTFNPPAETPQLTVATMRAGDRGEVKDVKAIDVDSTKPMTVELDVELNRGDTVVLRYLNGPFDYEDQAAYTEFLTQAFSKEPELAAAWDAIGSPARGGSGWQRVKEKLADKDLDRSAFVGNTAKLEKLIKSVVSNKVRSGETLVYKYFEEGPNIGVYGIRIHGPIRAIRDREELRSESLRKKLTGDSFDESNPQQLQEFFTRFLTKAFRRPATPAEVNGYVELVRAESVAAGSLYVGMHLAVRTVLLSPSFLYRDVGGNDVAENGGKLNQHELAVRLSYFLKSAPPDDKLAGWAVHGRLNETAVLGRETKRLMSKDFAKEFASQWLGLDSLNSLMPDPRLGKFTTRHQRTIRDEVGETFWHIWSENLPVTDFITPDFVFTDSEVGWDIYGLESLKKNRGKKDRNKIRRIEVPRDGRHGGLLGMSAVMMSTANGVDTQPVLRGVWLLENVLGTPPPEPPDAVPALTPDVNSKATVKQRLAAHMADESCAVCHRSIDALGFALESFDPLGQWRDHYPVFSEVDGKTTKEDGLKVDTTGVLPDGTQIKDVRDLKRWFSDNPEVFARCLSEKLLTYATGRKMSYRERDVIAKIVADQRKNELRFQELFYALVDSEIFRAK